MRRLLLAAALVAGCGDGGGGKDGDGDDFPRACDESEVDGDCVLYSGAGWTAADVEESCTAGGMLMPECPAAASVGTCVLEPGEFETVTTFYSGYWTGTSAIQRCSEAGGTFAEP
jgi:hypothetical protein